MFVDWDDGNKAFTLSDRRVDQFLAYLGGDNSVSHQGAIGGNLRVVSANEDDVVDVSDREDAVGGRTLIDLGGQHDGRGPCGPHGRGPFGFPLGKMLVRAFGFGRPGR